MHSPANGISSYRRDIDGLRAVAVLPVVFYHAGTGFTGGYVGVDVFFVISGFLITRLLARDLEDGRFSLLEFWHRRVRRIFPALFVMVLLTLIAGGFLMIPADYKELGQSALAQSLLAANFFFWDDTGYFARAAESKPLLHTWSLAVEEQFYVLFPLVLAWLWCGGRMRVRRVLGVALLVSLAASLPGPAWLWRCGIMPGWRRRCRACDRNGPQRSMSQNVSTLMLPLCMPPVCGRRAKWVWNCGPRNR